MKDLRIPVVSDEFVDLSEISTFFQGTIIGYHGDKEVGYVVYVDGEWLFVNSINFDCPPIESEETVVDLIDTLIKNKTCTHFKVLEFER